MDTTQIVAVVGAAGMLITGAGGFIISLLGQRMSARQTGATSDNLSVDTANDALVMARETWRERIALLEEKVDRLTTELESVKLAQTMAVNENTLLKKRVTELERENHELRAFAEQLKLRNEALERRVGAT